MPPDLRLFLATGVMDGHTTYFSSNYETPKLPERGARFAGTTCIVLTVMGCFLAAFLGIVAARALMRRPGVGRS